ncbi:hypothetical protein N0V93_007421 [Gnomoniopsis smithogilvyi]|uniref:Uncharacterized protein n=1 Tax=Gnomoniopsis smithogilvyi TaxID=1191159 RepID=A0A9W8YQ11_9PEZI|nr:hypothetical protein N0V93_007421 [Gnomoniopsis smithogilvyi]
MASDQPTQPPDSQGAPFYRPYPTYANHIHNLIRGPVIPQKDLSSKTPVMSSEDSARSDASADASLPLHLRPLPTMAEADERRRRLIESMVKMYPAEKMRIPEVRPRSGSQAEGPQGLSRELEDIIAAKQEQTKRYKEFHLEWTDLQSKLQKKSEELRAEYADLVEEVHSTHHKFIRSRMKKDDYNSARKNLAHQMDDVFETLGKIALTMGIMYAESRAVAQGANPTGDFGYGKLDNSACNAVPFLNYHFPEFVKKSNSTPPDPIGPRPHDVAFKNDLPSQDFPKMMDTVWSKYPTKLQDIHDAVFNKSFAGIKELTQKEKDNARALLGIGGEWSV